MTHHLQNTRTSRMITGLLCLISLLFSTGLTAQKVTINGYAPGAARRPVTFYIARDMISNVDQLLCSSTVDSTDRFTLEFDVKETVYGTVDIDAHRTDMFVEPGKVYNLSIDPLNYDADKEYNPYIQVQSLAAQLMDTDPKELNVVVSQFNTVYDDFLLQNFGPMYREHDKTKLDTFQLRIGSAVTELDNPYMKNYVLYKVALLEQLCQALSPAQIGKRYFTDRPVLYQNIEYMNLFNNYFTKYIFAVSKPLKYSDYPAILSGPDPFRNLMKLLAKDTILKHEQLRELVLLKNLQEMYRDKNFNQEKILNVLELAKTQCKFDENKIVAEDIIKVVTKLRVGTKAPEFELEDLVNKKVSLASMKGKYVLLSFWTTYCQGCITELDLLKPLYEKYKDRLNVVSISADRDFTKMYLFMKLKPNWNWTFLHVGSEVHLLKDYEVKSFPVYVLIDPQGNIAQYPVEAPGSGLDKTLQKFIQ
jgi:cytochrome oxidase Cu insertion factor (SCO1/SenC/PrrC family)